MKINKIQYFAPVVLVTHKGSSPAGASGPAGWSLREMDLEIKSHGRFLPCALEVFTVNGISADKDDFGETEQDYSDEPYTCVNLHFVPKLPTKETLDKYKIDIEEYSEICDALENELYVSYCGLCI